MSGINYETGDISLSDNELGLINFNIINGLEERKAILLKYPNGDILQQKNDHFAISHEVKNNYYYSDDPIFSARFLEVYQTEKSSWVLRESTYVFSVKNAKQNNLATIMGSDIPSSEKEYLCKSSNTKLAEQNTFTEFDKLGLANGLRMSNSHGTNGYGDQFNGQRIDIVTNSYIDESFAKELGQNNYAHTDFKKIVYLPDWIKSRVREEDLGDLNVYKKNIDDIKMYSQQEANYVPKTEYLSKRNVLEINHYPHHSTEIMDNPRDSVMDIDELYIVSPMYKGLPIMDPMKTGTLDDATTLAKQWEEKAVLPKAPYENALLQDNYRIDVSLSHLLSKSERQELLLQNANVHKPTTISYKERMLKEKNAEIQGFIELISEIETGMKAGIEVNVQRQDRQFTDVERVKVIKDFLTNSGEFSESRFTGNIKIGTDSLLTVDDDYKKRSSLFSVTKVPKNTEVKVTGFKDNFIVAKVIESPSSKLKEGSEVLLDLSTAKLTDSVKGYVGYLDGNDVLKKHVTQKLNENVLRDLKMSRVRVENIVSQLQNLAAHNKTASLQVCNQPTLKKGFSL